MEKLYENIRLYREARGMSQEELAKKTGYTDRSSITKIEKGQVDLQQSKISLFAKALDVPVLDLLGWTPSENFKMVNINEHKDRDFLVEYYALDAYDQGRVDQLIDDLFKKKSGVEDNIDVG